jgi:hypothetical protein
MVSDLSLGRLVRLAWEYRERFGVEPGEASVADAVRASTAIPYYFRPARCPDRVSGRVDTKGVSSTDFSLSASMAGTLFESGREAAGRFLDGWDFDDYKSRFR